ncbi:MAG: PorT family protein [Crocinitomicaceae bacterium]|jgi:hypothetical protein|nr:PorT family protein [Crocinitomicaceae bacterium]
MKKYSTILLLFITGIAFSQEIDDKKVQAGLTFGSGLNLNTAATKRMIVDGVGSSFTAGLTFNYRLTENNHIAFCSGAEIDFEKNRVKPSEQTTPSFYQFDDTKILQNEDANGSSNSTFFQYTNRTQKLVYLTIPVQMLFRTKYFGYMRYYGKFGVRMSFLLGNKIDDQGYTFENNSLMGNKIEAENVNMRADRDMNFLRANAGFSLGAEWNFAGSTSLAAEIGYYFGFIPIYANPKDKNRSLFYYDQNNGDKLYYSNDMSQNQLQLKISILF